MEAKGTFPLKEMTILATAVFASAISLSGLFPYVGFMVISLGKAKDENEAGYFSGYIASAMMFGRLVSSFWWGQIADKWGRKPVMIIGCLSIAIFSISFGCANTFQLALISRFLLGLTNPIWGIAKTLVSELCPPKHEARGMGLTTGCWSLGLVIGPACGGLLARPAQLYSKSFQGTIFETFPYLLPNLVTAFFALLGCFLLFFFFPETLSSGLPSSHSSSPSSSSTNSKPLSVSSAKATSESESPRGASIVELVQYPGVTTTLCAYLVISFSSICFDEVIPLWSMASHSHGGLQLPQVMIGTMLTITGCLLTIYTLAIYPLIAQSLGQRLSFKLSQGSLAVLSILTTLIHSLPPSSAARFPLLVTCYTASKASASLGFASLAIILNHCVTKDKRGSLNGLSMTFGSIAKSLGPLFAAMAFAWSINRIRSIPLDYHLVFLVISVSCLISVFIPLPLDESRHQLHNAEESRGNSSDDSADGVEREEKDYFQEEEGEDDGLVQMRSDERNGSVVIESLRGLAKYLPLRSQDRQPTGYTTVATSDLEVGLELGERGMVIDQMQPEVSLGI